MDLKKKSNDDTDHGQYFVLYRFLNHCGLNFFFVHNIILEEDSLFVIKITMFCALKASPQST